MVHRLQLYTARPAVVLAAALAILAIVLAPRVGWAADATLDLRVHATSATSDCPDAAALNLAVRAILGRDASAAAGPNGGEALHVDVSFARPGGLYVATLTSAGEETSGRRRFTDDGEGCTAVARAVAVAIAFLLDDAGDAEPETTPAPAPEPAPTPAPTPPKALEPATAPPTPDAPSPPVAPPELSDETVWYGWQVAAIDAIPAAMIGGAWLAEGSSESGNLVIMAGVATYALDGPAVHVAHHNGVGAMESLALRVVTPGIGMAVGSSVNCDGSVKCKNGAFVIGLASGAVLAVAMDAAFVSWGRPAGPATTSPRGGTIAPTFAFLPEGAHGSAPVFGVAGTF